MTEAAASTATFVLAIDLGSSGVKVGLVDAQGRLVASHTERYGMLLFPEGGAEQDAKGWWQAIVRCVRATVAEAQVPKEQIRAVGCTSMWSATVPVDEHAEPVGNCISWMDTRGGRHNRAMMDGFPKVQGYGLYRLLRWLKAAGLAPTQSGVDSLAHMLFLKHERPEIWQRTYKLLEPMDFVTFKLTGRATATRSTAFPTMVSDVSAPDPGRYHPALLAFAGVEEHRLAELIPVDAAIGPVCQRAADELGLSTSATVLAGVPDNHSSAIGSGATENYQAVAVLGTSGFIGSHLPERGLDLETFITTMPSPVPGRHLIFADLGNNGKVLDSYLDKHLFSEDELCSQARPDDAFERLDRLVERVPAGSEGVLFLPWFNGTLCPREDAAMRGAFLNVSHRTTRAHLTRAVLEGICLNWRWLLGSVEKFAKTRFELLRLAGGGARSNQWAQLMADVTGRPVHQQADPYNGNVLGMGFLLLRHLGLLKVEDFPKLARVTRIYEPIRAHAEIYDRTFTQFLASEKALRPIFHGMNGKT